MIISLAEALKAELVAHAGEFSLPFTVRRVYLPKATLEDLASLLVSVVPKADVTETSTRGHDEGNYTLDVAVQARLTKSGDEEIQEADALMTFVEELKAHLRRLVLQPDGYEPSVAVTVRNEPIYSVDHLDEHRVFTSLVTVGFLNLHPA